MMTLLIGNPMGIQLTSPDSFWKKFLARPRPDLKSSPSPCTPGRWRNFVNQGAFKTDKHPIYGPTHSYKLKNIYIYETTSYIL